MPTKQELIDALNRAAKAGDSQAANEIAEFIEAGNFDSESSGNNSLAQAEFEQQYGADTPDVFDQVQAEQPIDDSSIWDQLIGAGEAALTAATGATGGTIGMIAGTFDQLVKEIGSGEFGSQEAANRIADRASELMGQLTYSPSTEKGREYVGDIAEVGAAAAPLAGLGGQVQAIGQSARAAAPIARQAAKPATQAASAAIKPVKESTQAVFSYQSPTKQRIARLIEQGSADVDTAGFKIEGPAPKFESKVAQAISTGAPKLAKDPVAITALDQGFDKGVVASIAGASPSDKSAMARMLNIYEKGTKDALFRSKNRPTDVIGERISDNFNVVRKANKKAGADINKASQALKGKDVESLDIGQGFIDDLEDMGVTVTDDLKLIFKGSDVEDLPSVERTLSTVFRRMTGDKKPDAYELHRMKRFIDEQVSYGKAGEGLTGRSEAALKQLRRNIDNALDEKFPDYKKANDVYSETIQAIDSLQDVAGRKLDLTGDNASKQLGTLSRRVLSNAQSRSNVIDSLAEIDRVARKYPQQLAIEGPVTGRRKPDITQLVLFADELDSRFGPSARGSLQGQYEQVAQRGRQIVQSPTPTMAAADAAVGAAARGLDKIRGVSNEKAFAAMRELLKAE